MFATWKEVFVGKHIVKFMVQKGLAANAKAAVAMGQKLLQEGKIYYVGLKYCPKLNNFKNTMLYARTLRNKFRPTFSGTFPYYMTTVLKLDALQIFSLGWFRILAFRSLHFPDSVSW